MELDSITGTRFNPQQDNGVPGLTAQQRLRLSLFAPFRPSGPLAVRRPQRAPLGPLFVLAYGKAPALEYAGAIGKR